MNKWVNIFTRRTFKEVRTIKISKNIEADIINFGHN